jgi:DNA-binding NarL/FixJ family response regulator
MIVEDENLFQEMLRLTLGAQPGLEVVGAASEGATALQLARDLKPDVVLMDIELGDGPNGIETGIEIKKAVPSIGIVLLSTHKEKEKEYLTSVPLDQSEGWSYLLKQSVGDIDALTRAVEGAASGLVVLDPALVMSLRPKPNTSVGALTARQGDVLKLMAQGFSNSAIAVELSLGRKSVENYINAIYQHLQISGSDPIHPRVKAVLMYMQDSWDDS